MTPEPAFPTAEFFAVVADQVGNPIFVKDREHRWVWANAAFEELTGFSREAMLGKTDHDFFPATQADFFHAADRVVFRENRTLVVEEEAITDARGVVHILATTKAPLVDPEGKVTHLVGIVHDITRRKSLEQSLRLTNEELERRVEERTRDLRDAQQALLRRERLVVLGQLAGGLAHQIRHPLSVISNAVAIVRRKVKSEADPDLSKALRLMVEEVREANRIISDLIDFARVRDASLERVTAMSVIASVIADLHIPEGVSVNTPQSSDIELDVDPRQSRDAFGNLMRNAIEAVLPRGVIDVRIDQNESDVTISVVDDGPGIAPHVVRHLFEPLVTSKPLGLGLGLCTARALIENQGGQLVFVATPKGARFDIILPRPKETES